MPYYAPAPAASATSPNATTYNAVTYGAVQDGSTDDYTAIAAACAAASAAGGGTVLITGAVALSQELIVPAGVGLVGQAPYGGDALSGNTAVARGRIVPTAAASITQALVTLGGRGAYLWNISVDANNQARAAVRTATSYGNWIQGCEIFNGKEYALWVGTQDTWVAECKLNQDCRGSCLYVDDGGAAGPAPDCRFIGVHCSGGNGLYGNVYTRTSNNVFTACHIYPGGNMSGPNGNTVGTEYTITNASSGSPIKITTSSSHFLQNGQTCYVRGVGGNTNANYTWTVQNRTATTVDLYSLQYADISSGSNQATNLLDTTQLAVGAAVTGVGGVGGGAGIPAATTVSAINANGTTISLSNNATVTATQGATATSGGILLSIASQGNSAYTSGGAIAAAGSHFGYHFQDNAYNRISGGSYVDGEKHPDFRDVIIRTSGNNTAKRHSLHGMQFHNDNDTVASSGGLGAGNGQKICVELRNSNSGTITGTMIQGCDGSGAGANALAFDAFLKTGTQGSIFNTSVVGCTSRFTNAFYTGARPQTLVGCTSYTGGETSAEVTPVEPVGTPVLATIFGQTAVSTGAASATYLMPFYNPTYMTFTNVSVRWQAAGSGSCDFGIYNSAGTTMLAHVGVTTAATAQLSKTYALSVPYKAAPGWYMFAGSFDTTAQVFFGSGQLTGAFSTSASGAGVGWTSLAGCPATIAASSLGANNTVSMNFSIT